jgi:hypothetical protein
VRLRALGEDGHMLDAMKLKIIKPVAPLALIALMTAGCSAQQQQSRMTKALDNLQGQSIADFVAEHGDPDTLVKTGDRETAFRWVITGESVGGAVPLNGALIVVRPHELTCTIVLKAVTTAKAPELKDWTITGGSWQGAC